MPEQKDKEKWNALMLAFLQGTLCYYDDHPVCLSALDFYHGLVEVVPYIKGIPDPGGSYIPGVSILGSRMTTRDIHRITVSQAK